MIFLLYLAVNTQMRSKRYGSKILSWLKDNDSKKEIILNVEMPDGMSDNNDQRISRILFYEKNGFTMSRWLLSIDGEDYNILSSQDEIDINAFRELVGRYRIGTIKSI